MEIKEFEFTGSEWRQSVQVLDKEGNESIGWKTVPVTDVHVGALLLEYEDLVFELSELEVELYKLKESYLIAEAKIVSEVDFKALYGANNQKIRDQHIKGELQDMVGRKARLQFSIDFIRNYLVLLREVIRTKNK